jgi:multidrug efflux pump subunit AcrA (membrane-fusion protein)
VSLDPIYASFEVDEPTFLAFRHAGKTDGRPGLAEQARPSQVRLALAGDAGFPREGRVDFVDNQLDAATGTIRVRARFSNPDGALTPGLFVRIRLPGRDAGAGVLVRDERSALISTSVSYRGRTGQGDRLPAGHARASRRRPARDP